MIASPQSSSKDGRATDSCFALIGAHQCGVLMLDVRLLATSVSTPSEKHVVSTETIREATVITTEALLQGGRLLAMGLCSLLEKMYC